MTYLGIKITGQCASDAVNPLASMLNNVLWILLIPGLDAGLLANQTLQSAGQAIPCCS